MNILSFVKAKHQREQRLNDAQLEHIRSRAYRGVVVSNSAPAVVMATIEGKRYACTPVE